MRSAAVVGMVLAGLSLVDFTRLAAEEKKTPPKLELTADEKAVLELTNKARAAEKLPPLAPNPVLFSVARAHSANQAKQETLAHKLDGKECGARLLAAGYDYSRAGENVAVTDIDTPEGVFKGWMNSKAHHDNILNGEFKEIGIGLARSAKGDTYYTQVFATPGKK